MSDAREDWQLLCEHTTDAMVRWAPQDSVEAAKAIKQRWERITNSRHRRT